MHIEIQVALNFVISYLYNKLPRRRVNIFGEELEKALKDKFRGHWYPTQPFKGSAFRCLKTGDPIDTVLERAARESGVPIQDILENLPQELSVWVDPGEVSYRIGEKGAVKILYTEAADPLDETSADREVTKTFNPEAQCFRPIDNVSCSLSNLSLSPKSSMPTAASVATVVPTPAVMPTPTPTAPQYPSIGTIGSQLMSTLASITGGSQMSSSSSSTSSGGHLSSAPSPTSLHSFKGSPSPVPAFLPRSTAPLTFTTATFAQTKFGSTKLKTSSKRANRMSPTEFSNYIKQRAMQQQLHHSNHHGHHIHGQSMGALSAQTSPGRSLSPHNANQINDNFFFQTTGPYHFNNTSRSNNIFDQPGGNAGGLMPTDFYNKYQTTSGGASSYLDPLGTQFYNGGVSGAAMNGTNFSMTGASGAGAAGAGVTAATTAQPDNGKLLDNLNFGGLGGAGGSYSANNYQHLLVAN